MYLQYIHAKISPLSFIDASTWLHVWLRQTLTNTHRRTKEGEEAKELREAEVLQDLAHVMLRPTFINRITSVRNEIE